MAIVLNDIAELKPGEIYSSLHFRESLVQVADGRAKNAARKFFDQSSQVISLLREADACRCEFWKNAMAAAL